MKITIKYNKYFEYLLVKYYNVLYLLFIIYYGK